MDNFVVSARKYRPETFDTVVGQQAITTTLKNAIRNGHLAQSFLFCGPRGVGKTTCARILAKTINCMNPSSDMEACGECESCKGFHNNASQNIYELDAASNRSVEAMRNLIEQVRIPPQIGKYKVYIIDEVHMLTSEAFNTFLKTLEEPPVYAKFILATTEKHKIIPTILSRCQIFDFRRIKIEDIVKHLLSIAEKEGILAEEEALRIVAQKADGGLRDALSMFDQIVSFSGNSITYAQVIQMLNILDYEYYFELFDYLVQGQTSACLNLFNQVLENGFDAQNFLSGLSQHFRNLMIMQDSQTIPLLEASLTLGDRYAKQTKKCNVFQLLRALELCNTCDVNYKMSNHKRLLVEILLLQLGEIFIPLEATKGVEPSIQQYSVPKENQTPSSNNAIQSPINTEKVAPKTDAIPVAPSVTNFNVSSGRSSISLKNMAEITSPKKEEENRRNIPSEDKPFTQQEMENFWQEYLVSMQKAAPVFCDILTHAQPNVQENSAIGLKIANEFLSAELEEKKKDLLAFLRKKLQNDGIHFVITIDNTIKSEVSVYSPQEKLKAMSESNPAIQTLKKDLQLDIEL